MPNILTEKELHEFKVFKAVHYCCKGKPTRISLHFDYGSGIGVRVDVKCKNCKKKVDITDLESW